MGLLLLHFIAKMLEKGRIIQKIDKKYTKSGIKSIFSIKKAKIILFSYTFSLTK